MKIIRNRIGTKEFCLPEGFSVGFSRMDITPKEFPFPTFDLRQAETIHSHVYTTCVAVSDGEDLAFFLTSDLRAAYAEMVKTVKGIIGEMTGVPEDHVLFCTTHNHSGPDIAKIHTHEVVSRWVKDFYEQVPKLIEDALSDLAPTKLFVGKAETKNLSFVRRYFLKDGSFWGIHTGSNPAPSDFDRHETEPDPEMRVVKCCREGKKDVLLVNWQCHAATDASMRPTIMTADFIHEFRKGAEERFDVLFAYYNGACGNVVSGSRMESDQRPNDTDEQGRLLVDVLAKAMENLTPAASGKLCFKSGVVHAELKNFTPERVKLAEEVWACKDPEEKKKLRKQYGFQSKWEANAILNIMKKREKIGAIFPIHHTAISFGDIGFVNAPYEMFDTNGLQVRNASPFPITFICSNTDGALSYMPSLEACPRGGYEVYVCHYVSGTSEACAEKMAELLNETAKQK